MHRLSSIHAGQVTCLLVRNAMRLLICPSFLHCSLDFRLNRGFFTHMPRFLAGARAAGGCAFHGVRVPRTCCRQIASTESRQVGATPGIGDPAGRRALIIGDPTGRRTSGIGGLAGRRSPGIGNPTARRAPGIGDLTGRRNLGIDTVARRGVPECHAHTVRAALP